MKLGSLASVNTALVAKQDFKGISIRLSEEERDAWKEAAKRDGHETVAGWLKDFASKRIRTQSKPKKP